MAESTRTGNGKNIKVLTNTEQQLKSTEEKRRKPKRDEERNKDLLKAA